MIKDTKPRLSINIKAKRMKRVLCLTSCLIVVLASCRVTTAATFVPFHSAHVKIGDITMYYEEYGKGEPLILLNGGLTSTTAWVKQIPAFSKRYHVIALDNRGQGQTTDSEAPITYDLMAEDTLRLMDHIGIDAALIVGWSDGGIIGIEMAIHHPNRVRALVAYGANTMPEGLKGNDSIFFGHSSEDVLLRWLSNPYHSISPQPVRLPRIVEKIRKMWLTEPHITAEELLTIKAPTLIIQGQKDTVVSTAHAKSIAKAIPNAKFILLPNVGHDAMIRKPKVLNKVILDFLKDK